MFPSVIPMEQINKKSYFSIFYVEIHVCYLENKELFYAVKLLYNA